MGAGRDRVCSIVVGFASKRKGEKLLSEGQLADAVGDDVDEAQVVVEVGRFEEGEVGVAAAGVGEELREVLAEMATAVEEVGQGDDFAGALCGEIVDGVGDGGGVAVEIGGCGEGVAGLCVQPGGHLSDGLVGVFQGRAVGHYQECGLRPVGRAGRRVDGLDALKGDGGQFFMEAETGRDADGQLWELYGDFGDVGG